MSVSKFLAKHLRHRPGAIGLQLEKDGWARIDELLSAARRARFPISRDELDAAVHAPGKRRYAYDATGQKVRAVQGHSVDVDLGYTPTRPPATLYHGTHAAALDQIVRVGLQRMGRTHVHLSPDAETARVVGARRGRPVIVEVAAGDAHAAGQRFYRADNGVWLTDRVAPKFLRVP